MFRCIQLNNHLTQGLWNNGKRMMMTLKTGFYFGKCFHKQQNGSRLMSEFVLPHCSVLVSSCFLMQASAKERECVANREGPGRHFLPGSKSNYLDVLYLFTCKQLVMACVPGLLSADILYRQPCSDELRRKQMVYVVFIVTRVESKV